MWSIFIICPFDILIFILLGTTIMESQLGQQSCSCLWKGWNSLLSFGGLITTREISGWRQPFSLAAFHIGSNFHLRKSVWVFMRVSQQLMILHLKTVLSHLQHQVVKVQIASGAETQKHVLTVYWSVILWMTVGMGRMKTAVVSTLHCCLLTPHKNWLANSPLDWNSTQLQ